MRQQKVEEVLEAWAKAYFAALVPSFESPGIFAGTEDDEITPHVTRINFVVEELEHECDHLWYGHLVSKVITPRPSGDIARHRAVAGHLDSRTGLWNMTANVAALDALMIAGAAYTTSGWDVRDEKPNDDSDEWMVETNVFMRLAATD